jgi:hypothetical protein
MKATIEDNMSGRHRLGDYICKKSLIKEVKETVHAYEAQEELL